MSADAHDLMSHEWARWQGHLVNGVFPLGRFLGCSEHSGVFLTKAKAPGEGEVAIKLIPASRAQEEQQLPRWARAAALAHSHLLPLLEWGACQLDGLPYVYVVMEYADQTLAQLLLQRALTADEAREMLGPVLKALAFLHPQRMLQGQLKPANILVVGDQLKLASDSICEVGESALRPRSTYDAPEDQSHSTASDIWALGISLYESLTRRSAPNPNGQRGPISLPGDFPPEFRDLVSRCLSLKPTERPDVADLLAFTEGRPIKPVQARIDPPPAIERTAPAKPRAASPRAPVSEPVRDVPRKIQPAVQAPTPKAWLIPTLIAAVVVGLSVGAVRFFGSHPSSDARPSTASTGASSAIAAVPDSPPTSKPVPSTAGPARGEPLKTVALHEVIPEVPHNAARTIHGHIKVSVRAIVASNGSVSAVIADKGGPSRYFEKLAVEAARKWKFPPADGSDSRVMEVRFDFGRDGTTGRATLVH